MKLIKSPKFLILLIVFVNFQGEKVSPLSPSLMGAIIMVVILVIGFKLISKNA